MSFKRCPTCGNEKHNDNICRCDSCCRIFCSECMVNNHAFFGSKFECPHCGKSNYEFIDKIDNPEEYEEDEMNSTLAKTSSPHRPSQYVEGLLYCLAATVLFIGGCYGYNATKHLSPTTVKGGLGPAFNGFLVMCSILLIIGGISKIRDRW